LREIAEPATKVDDLAAYVRQRAGFEGVQSELAGRRLAPELVVEEPYRAAIRRTGHGESL
jgi:hypothetical protein